MVKNRRLPPDQSFRDQITGDLERTMLVEAAAGTGKTTCLVARMVGLLREGLCRIDAMAAVTFTRKASAELRTRFQLALERGAREATDAQRERLVEALAHVERCFIGTIHSFCARLLRERPVEAGVDPGFVELDETIDDQIRQAAWREHVATMIATNSRVLPELERLGLKVASSTRRSRTLATELDELGLEPAELGPAFMRFAEFSDVDDWPAPPVPLPDLNPGIKALTAYAAHMRAFPLPPDFGNDKLMPKYDLIGRMTRRLDLNRPAELMEVLDLFQELERSDLVQRNWIGGKALALAELDRWNQFFRDHASPLIVAWREHRYEPVMRAIRPAAEVYDRMRRERNGLNYQDLLLRSVHLLRDKPDVRRYFRDRFTHLLVDEFQDTDPLQAEVMLLLTADDCNATDWQRCRPVAGSLFVVGDPKQSIYRFRRADIVTYNKVRSIIEQVGGSVIPLTANFRSVKPLIDWINGCFDRVFPASADDCNPANRPLDAGRLDGVEAEPVVNPSVGSSDDLSFELQVGDHHLGEGSSAVDGSGGLLGISAVERLLIPPNLRSNNEVAEYEADLIARTIRHIIDSKSPVPRTDSERSRGLPAHATAGDFLIVARNRGRLALYASKLQQYGVPHLATGGSVLNEVPELELLYVCLAAVVRSDDPIALVATLRSELFGVADTVLYDFRRYGGRFSYRSEIPSKLNELDATILKDAFERLENYSRWLSRMPAAPAIERIAADLGLIARAAADEDGDVQAGSLLKAIERLRFGDTSLTAGDYVEALGRLVDKDEHVDGISVRPPSEAPVRLMNLHQCKGLEAPFVFLVDPSGLSVHDVDVHIDRSGTRSLGYLPIYGRKRSEWSAPPLLAQPPNWKSLAAREQEFLNAEAMRLLYVAATRAGVKLVISQRDGKNNERNPWFHFARDLQCLPNMPDPGAVVLEAAEPIPIEMENWKREVLAIEKRWQTVLRPSYRVLAIKESAIRGKEKPHGAEKAGAEWGQVLHALLDAAMKQPTVDLQFLAISALELEELPVTLVNDVVATVKGVLASEIWRRARQSEKCLTEVPLAMPVAAAKSDNGLPTVMRGVIDLVFKETTGWVIVDYKSERVDAPSIPELVAYYRPQIEVYADVWTKIVGQPVIESGLFFTHNGVYVALPK